MCHETGSGNAHLLQNTKKGEIPNGIDVRLVQDDGVVVGLIAIQTIEKENLICETTFRPTKLIVLERAD